MADPTPHREGLEGILDAIADLRRQVNDLSSPSGTQRGQTSDRIAGAVAYLNSLRTYGSVGAGSATLSNIPADGTTRWYSIGPGAADGPNSHFVGPIEVPTGKLLVTASVGEASITPNNNGFMIAYVSFRVLDADGVTVMGIGAKSGRLYFNARIGTGMTTGPQVVDCDPSRYRAPFRATLYVGIWGQNTGQGAQTVTCAFNTPALRVEVIGDGVN